jgi:hypothetical protein
MQDPRWGRPSINHWTSSRATTKPKTSMNFTAFSGFSPLLAGSSLYAFGLDCAVRGSQIDRRRRARHCRCCCPWSASSFFFVGKVHWCLAKKAEGSQSFGSEHGRRTRHVLRYVLLFCLLGQLGSGSDATSSSPYLPNHYLYRHGRADFLDARANRQMIEFGHCQRDSQNTSSFTRTCRSSHHHFSCYSDFSLGYLVPV